MSCSKHRYPPLPSYRAGIEMDAAQKKTSRNIEKQFPGCLGRMVNLFDLSAGVASKKLLMDKPHSDGSSLSKGEPDVIRILSPPPRNEIKDEMILSESRSSPNDRSKCTPMKMLIAQEMSRETECKHRPANVVAKLMGFDGLPWQNPGLSVERVPTRDHYQPRSTHPEIPHQIWRQDDTFIHKPMKDKLCKSQEVDGYKDIYEIQKQSERTNAIRETSPQNRCAENTRDKKIANVQQKFTESIPLATDEKHKQQKELQDALEVLSSKREFLLNFIKEPNSLVFKHLQDLESVCAPPETKCITVLRPSKMVDNEKYPMMGKKNDNQTKRPVEVIQETRRGKSRSILSPCVVNRVVNDYGSQPTRIVVLKPNIGQTHETKSVISPLTTEPRNLPGENCFEASEDRGIHISREVTHHVHENVKGHRRDETLLSSVFSNGYIGDSSSSNKSEYEFPLENFSDTEMLSPTSRHSWDCINRSSNPFSTSSLSCTSYSPETSVSREAKKRLSERWAVMASYRNSQEERRTQRSSGTLGEMLALSDTKVSVRRNENGNNSEQEPRISASCLRNNLSEIEEVAESPRSLLRSKSLPVCSTLHGDETSIRILDSEACQMHFLKESNRRSKSLSFKGRVSNFLFSRNKRSSEEKCYMSRPTEESRFATVESPQSSMCPQTKFINHASQYNEDNRLEEASCPTLHRLGSNTSCLMHGKQEGNVSEQVGLSVSKPLLENIGENQDQPSPISVLELSFEDDATVIPEFSGKQLPMQSLKSNLIDKSPPIGSIARSLSWGDRSERALPCLLKPSIIYPRAMEEEQDCFAILERLLSTSGLDDKVQSHSAISRWHSPQSPLNPSLREKYACMDDDEPLHEAKRRQRRSNRQLVFDFVNTALMSMSGFGSEESLVDGLCCGPKDRLNRETSSITVDCVWAQLKEWFVNEASHVSRDDIDWTGLVVERVVRKEVLGKGWLELFKLAVDNIGKDIEWKLLEELVDEALNDFTGRI